jgi:hypothetical protein
MTQNVRMETSWQNLRANLDPFVSVCGVRRPVVAHPGLREAPHEGQFQGSRAQVWHQELVEAYTPWRITLVRTFDTLTPTIWLYYATQPPTEVHHGCERGALAG